MKAVRRFHRVYVGDDYSEWPADAYAAEPNEGRTMLCIIDRAGGKVAPSGQVTAIYTRWDAITLNERQENV